jgi:hypothetical protein
MSALEKDNLETEKLRLEIDELQKPLLRKPSFYAVVGPILLAFGTLGLGAYTGLFNAQNERFNAQNERLRNDTTLLEINKHKLNAENNVLRAEVDLEKKNLEKEKKEIDLKLAGERERLKETLESERAKMSAELGPLRTQLAAVTTEIDKKNRELGELPVHTLIDQMKRDSALTPFNQSSTTLMDLLEKDTEKIAIVDGRIARLDNPTLKANLLYVIYRAKPEPERLKALLEVIEENHNEQNIWSVIGAGGWGASDASEILPFILVNASRLSIQAKGEALQIFHFPRFNLKEIKTKLSVENRTSLVLLGRQVALDKAAHRAHRMYGILTASFFLPEALPILAGSILSNVDDVESAKAGIREDIEEIRSATFLERNLIMSKTLADLDFPKNLQADPSIWQKWKSLPSVKKWSAAVFGDDLKKVLDH